MLCHSQTILKLILKKRQMFSNSSHSMLSGQILGASGSLLPFQFPLMVRSSPQRARLQLGLQDLIAVPHGTGHL
jgi:hypothetical protein